MNGKERQDMRDGVQACKAMWEGTLLQTWVASVYGVGESGSTLADPNTGPCWSLLLLFSLSEWRLRLILEPRQGSPTLHHSLCAPLGCRRATDSSRAAAGSPASFSAAAAQACLRSNSRHSWKKDKNTTCIEIVIYGRKSHAE